MTALSEGCNRSTSPGVQHEDPAAASVEAFVGSLIVLDASGNAKPGVTGTGLIARGVCYEYADNSSGSAGDVSIKSRPGVFAFENSGSSDEITAAEIGDSCYIVDDNTVAKTSGGGTRSVAGRVDRLEGGKVYVAVAYVHSMDGDLLAANNLSDVAAAATARANIGANKGVLMCRMVSLVAGAHYFPIPDYAITFTKLQVVVDGALATADLVVTAAINTTNITTGAVTVTQAGSAAGSRGEADPSAANVSDGSNDYLRLTCSGNTAAVAGTLLAEYTY